eukprot:gene12491-14451_t
MKHSPLFTKRRFLKFSLLGVAGAATLVAGAGAYITQTNRYRQRYGQLLVVDGHLADIAHTLAEACVPNRPGFPDIEQAEVVKRLDEELFFVSDNISSDLKAAFYLLEMFPLAYGHLSRFSRLTVAERKQVLTAASDTQDDTLRAVIANLSAMMRWYYYGHPSTWKVIGIHPIQRKSIMTNKIFEHTDYGQLSEITADVCIIGSGCGGATVAHRLAQAGIDVVILEKGGYYPASTFDNRELNQAAKVDAERALSTDTNASTMLTYGELVGGTSVHYWADSYRTPADRLALWESQYGITGHSAEKLAPIFADIEKIHHIQEAEPFRYNKMNQLFKEAVEALGWGGHPMLQARSGCSGSGHCMQGCAIDAKQSQLVTHIPASLALGTRIYADLKADDFVFEGHRVTQLKASVIDRARNRPNGKTITVKAKHFVVAAGGFNTPAFLLNQPRLRDALPALGKHFGFNPSTYAHGLFDEPIIMWRNIPAAYGVDGFRLPRFDAKGQYIEGGYLLVPDQIQPGLMAYTIPGFNDGAAEWMEKMTHVGGAIGWLDDHPDELGEMKVDGNGVRQIHYPYGPTTQKMLRDLMKKAAIVNFKAGARKVMLGDLKRTTLNSVDEIDRIDAIEIKPGSLTLVAPHPFGGCRMGTDPKTSVTDSSHRVHGIDNLFVADPSVFPTGPSVDPSVSIMAFSYIAAEHIANAMGKKTAPLQNT